MNYIKKMCILRQVKQGFSGDGKTLSGLVKAEQYGKNLSVEVSVINFAPLSLGEYYCLLSDKKGHTEILALRGKSLFNILTDMEIDDGFCAVVCFVKNEIVPIAYGVNGNGNYDWKEILSSALSPVVSQKTSLVNEPAFTKERKETLSPSSPNPSVDDADDTDNIAENTGNVDTAQADTGDTDGGETYDDETVATENYYNEAKNGQNGMEKTFQNADAQNSIEKQNEKTGADLAENGNADELLHPFETNPDVYYLSVKSEIDELMKTHPRDDTLTGAFACSEWVRVKGEEGNPQYLVGVIYEDGRARYVCYALVAKDKDAPPQEIKDVSVFVPVSPFDENKGFFVIFQSASTGECIKPTKA